MSGFPRSGRSNVKKLRWLRGCFRPEAAGGINIQSPFRAADLYQDRGYTLRKIYSGASLGFIRPNGIRINVENAATRIMPNSQTNTVMNKKNTIQAKNGKYMPSREPESNGIPRASRDHLASPIHTGKARSTPTTTTPELSS